MARIPDEVIERLKEEVSLQRLVELAGVELRRQGKDLVGLCPFHEERTGSLVISPEKNLWHCMGACQAGGSVIDWVMRAESVSFRHAVELLRDGVAPTPLARQRAAVRSTVSKLPSPLAVGADEGELLERVAGFYAQTLRESPEAQGYLQRRGLADGALLERFRLGFANRTLGYRLPAKNRRAGAELLADAQRVGFGEPSLDQRQIVLDRSAHHAGVLARELHRPGGRGGIPADRIEQPAHALELAALVVEPLGMQLALRDRQRVRERFQRIAEQAQQRFAHITNTTSRDQHSGHRLFLLGRRHPRPTPGEKAPNSEPGIVANALKPWSLAPRPRQTQSARGHYFGLVTLNIYHILGYSKRASVVGQSLRAPDERRGLHAQASGQAHNAREARVTPTVLHIADPALTEPGRLGQGHLADLLLLADRLHGDAERWLVRGSHGSHDLRRGGGLALWSSARAERRRGLYRPR
jgi:hypothetical protein